MIKFAYAQNLNCLCLRFLGLVFYNYRFVRVSMDNYNLHRYLLMCMDAYNLKAMSVDDYGLYGSFLINFILWACVLMIMICVVLF